MAIPYQPQGLTAEQADGNILLTWIPSVGATTYQIQRSTDGINFSDLIVVGQVYQYVDPYPGVSIQYWYQLAAINTDGTSPYSAIVTIVAAPPGEMSLAEIRLRAQQTADRVESNFVTVPEWNSIIRLSEYELYDNITTTYEDYNIAKPVFINTDGTTFQYDLPNGLNYLGNVLGGVSGLPAPRLYKISGLDLGVNTSNNAWVTLHRFDWIDRNAYVYPNSTSTIYGVYNMRYRPMGTNTFTQQLAIIPTPAGNQQIRLWYTPVLPAMLKDTDVSSIGFSGWIRYVIVRAAKYALDKEEGSDTSKLDAELVFLKQRITESASNRDQGEANTISNTRRDPVYGGTGWGDGGANGGW